MAMQSRDIWSSFSSRQQMADFGPESGTGFSRSFFQPLAANDGGGRQRFNDENVSPRLYDFHSYATRNQCQFSKSSALVNRNNANQFAPDACSFGLSPFQLQPFLDQDPQFVTPTRTCPTSLAGAPRVKRPLNAFMIFMKEMRQKIVDECQVRESTVVNQVIGRRWHALNHSEQLKYYEMAKREKELHRQLHPSWSVKDNYGRKRKRKRKDSLRGGEVDSGDEVDSFVEAKKCRARYGMVKQQWCKSCRIKKRCIRFISDKDSKISDSKENDLARSISSRLNISGGQFGLSVTETLNYATLGTPCRTHNFTKDVPHLENRIVPFRRAHRNYPPTDDRARFGQGMSQPPQRFYASFPSGSGVQFHTVLSDQNQFRQQSQNSDCLGQGSSCVPNWWNGCDDTVSSFGEKSSYSAVCPTNFGFSASADKSPFNPYSGIHPAGYAGSAWGLGDHGPRSCEGLGTLVLNGNGCFQNAEERSVSAGSCQPFPSYFSAAYPGGVQVASTSTEGRVPWTAESAQSYGSFPISCGQACQRDLSDPSIGLAGNGCSGAQVDSKPYLPDQAASESCSWSPRQSSGSPDYELLQSLSPTGLGSCQRTCDVWRRAEDCLAVGLELGVNDLVILGRCFAMCLLALLVSVLALVMNVCLTILLL